MHTGFPPPPGPTVTGDTAGRRFPGPGGLGCRPAWLRGGLYRRASCRPITLRGTPDVEEARRVLQTAASRCQPHPVPGVPVAWHRENMPSTHTRPGPRVPRLGAAGVDCAQRSFQLWPCHPLPGDLSSYSIHTRTSSSLQRPSGFTLHRLQTPQRTELGRDLSCQSLSLGSPAVNSANVIDSDLKTKPHENGDRGTACTHSVTGARISHKAQWKGGSSLSLPVDLCGDRYRTGQGQTRSPQPQRMLPGLRQLRLGLTPRLTILCVAS